MQLESNLVVQLSKQWFDFHVYSNVIDPFMFFLNINEPTTYS